MWPLAKHTQIKRSSTRKSEPASQSEIPATLQSLRRIVGTGFIVAGVALMDTKFWSGFVLGCLGFALLIWEVCVEPELLKRPLWIQATLLATCFVGFGVFVILVIDPIAPPDMVCYSPQGEYPSGTTISGIEWNPHFTELQVAITNPTNDDYENLGLGIRPETWTHKAVVNTKSCELTTLPGKKISVAMNIKGGDATIMTNRVGEDLDVHDSLGKL